MIYDYDLMYFHSKSMSLISVMGFKSISFALPTNCTAFNEEMRCIHYSKDALSETLIRELRETNIKIQMGG